ncbi:hypothetical protein U8527_07855 [Kordia algicida OT-1]|uniref:Uncharacterized protein n=1 Tax=Kordia algicida OT-1 TaxID=391587 RepID=A9E8V2_9FLAO|nr:hypothetical protein [Kordia algicida]EDP94817.1 hypothetical protein KAOT1_01285 [Kordia algicida OT-1]
MNFSKFSPRLRNFLTKNSCYTAEKKSFKLKFLHRTHVFLGLRTVQGYKLWLLLVSPLLVTIPVIAYLMNVTEFQKETTQSAIPFFVMVVIFYAHSFWKLKKNQQKANVS